MTPTPPPPPELLPRLSDSFPARVHMILSPTTTLRPRETQEPAQSPQLCNSSPGRPTALQTPPDTWASCSGHSPARLSSPRSFLLWGPSFSVQRSRFTPLKLTGSFKRQTSNSFSETGEQAGQCGWECGSHMERVGERRFKPNRGPDSQPTFLFPLPGKPVSSSAQKTARRHRVSRERCAQGGAWRGARQTQLCSWLPALK